MPHSVSRQCPHDHCFQGLFLTSLSQEAVTDKEEHIKYIRLVQRTRKAYENYRNEDPTYTLPGIYERLSQVCNQHGRTQAAGGGGNNGNNATVPPASSTGPAAAASSNGSANQKGPSNKVSPSFLIDFSLFTRHYQRRRGGKGKPKSKETVESSDSGTEGEDTVCTSSYYCCRPS